MSNSHKIAAKLEDYLNSGYFSGLRDMREVLDKVRTSAENYQRPRQSGWAVVPTDQYAFTNFL